MSHIRKVNHFYKIILEENYRKLNANQRKLPSKLWQRSCNFCCRRTWLCETKQTTILLLTKQLIKIISSKHLFLWNAIINFCFRKSTVIDSMDRKMTAQFCHFLFIFFLYVGNNKRHSMMGLLQQNIHIYSELAMFFLRCGFVKIFIIFYGN